MGRIGKLPEWMVMNRSQLKDWKKPGAFTLKMRFAEMPPAVRFANRIEENSHRRTKIIKVTDTQGNPKYYLVYVKQKGR